LVLCKLTRPKFSEQTLVEISQPDFDFKMIIAIRIAIENLSRINQTLI